MYFFNLTSQCIVLNNNLQQNIYRTIIVRYYIYNEVKNRCEKVVSKQYTQIVQAFTRDVEKYYAK